jgi:AraC-like DNA-binding protein
MTYEGIRLTVFAIGAVQGIFLVFALLLKETANRTATRTLVALVGVFTAILLGALARALLPPPESAWIGFVNINTELAIGPLLLLFVRSIFHPRRPWKLKDSLHFLPLSLGLSAWAAAYLSLRARGLDPTLGLYPTEVRVYVLFKATFFFAYLVYTLRTLHDETVGTRRLVAGRREVELGWLRSWLIVFGGVAGVLYGLATFHALGPTVPVDDVASFVLASMIYGVSLMVLLRPRLLSARPRRPRSDGHSEDIGRLEAWLGERRAYLDPELTLRDLAEALGLAENRLSAVINEGLGTTFYDLLNRYRLEHFERLARDESRRGLTILDLAFESGFNSKASFYRAFRQAHDTTPTVFRRNLLA